MVVLFHCSCFYFLQVWCIPGTFIFNLLGGALFGIKTGFVLCVLMNSSGGFTCYLISKMFCNDLVHNKLKEKFDSISKTVKIFQSLTQFRLRNTKTISFFTLHSWEYFQDHLTGWWIYHLLTSVSLDLTKYSFRFSLD